jgi:phenylacetate-CoA ligase
VRVNTHRAMNEMRIRIEAANADAATSPALAQRLEKILQETFSLRIPVECVAVGTLPRFEMKARRWVKNSDEQ